MIGSEKNVCSAWKLSNKYIEETKIFFRKHDFMPSEIIICGMHTEQRRGKGKEDEVKETKTILLDIDFGN
jgi:hypothetical protein